MDKKKVFVTGATGLLGRQVVESFNREDWDVIGSGLSRAVAPIIKLDLCDAGAVVKTIMTIKPNVVVHCAANRFPDKCDDDEEGAYALNVTSSYNLATICAGIGIHLIYISTDYVFSGTTGEAPYEADSKPRPSNIYGLTKLKGEESIQCAYREAGKVGHCVVLRIPVLYGKALTHKESAVNTLIDTLLEAQRENAKVPVDNWSIKYPTNTEDVARVIKDIASQILSMSDKSRLPPIVQFTSEDKYTKYEICKLFADLLGCSSDMISPINTEIDDDTATKRPYDCHLSTKNLKDLGINVCTVDFKEWWRHELKSISR